MFMTVEGLMAFIQIMTWIPTLGLLYLVIEMVTTGIYHCMTDKKEVLERVVSDDSTGKGFSAIIHHDMARKRSYREIR